MRTITVTITDGGQRGIEMTIELLSIMEGQARDRATMVPDCAVPMREAREVLERLVSGPKDVLFTGDSEAS
jgi:hypothetical protein